MSTRSILVLSTVGLMLTLAACGKTTEPPVPTPIAAAPVPNVSDVDVTEHVKTAILQNELLKDAQVAVVTTKGDVRLSGVVDSQAQIDAAVNTARTVEGVHAVHGELTLKK